MGIGLGYEIRSGLQKLRKKKRKEKTVLGFGVSEFGGHLSFGLWRASEFRALDMI